MVQEKSQGGESSEVAQDSVIIFKKEVTDKTICKSCVIFIESDSRKVRYIEKSFTSY